MKGWKPFYFQTDKNVLLAWYSIMKFPDWLKVGNKSWISMLCSRTCILLWMRWEFTECQEVSHNSKLSKFVVVKIQSTQNLTPASSVKFELVVNTKKLPKLVVFHPAMMAEWAYERLQIQVAESQRSQVGIPLGAIYQIILNKKELMLCECHGLWYDPRIVVREIGYETIWSHLDK